MIVGKEFVTAFKQVANSVSNQEMAVLGNVCLKLIYPDMIELVITDGNQLTIRRLKIKDQTILNECDGKKFLIKNPKQVAKFLNNKAKFIELEFGTDYFGIKQDGIGIEVELADWIYPKYEQLIDSYQTLTLEAPFKTQSGTTRIKMSRKYLEMLMKNFTSTHGEVIMFEISDVNSAVYITNNSQKDVMEFDLLMPILSRD